MIDMLVMLKNNLEIISDYMDTEAQAAKDAELTQYIESAKAFIEREGVTLDVDAIDDCMLIVMYAGWLYERRKDPTAQMPRMVRWNLNNRLFAEKLS